MSQLLADQTAVVTGGSSGLGRAISLTFAEHGADVVVADIRDDPRGGGEPTHERIEAETDQQAHYVECDVTDRGDLEVAAEATAELGGIDIWVNNAGIDQHIDFLEVTEEDFDQLMDINLKGVFFGAQVAARRLAESDDGGAIINMASLAAVRADRFLPVYSASKAAVQQLTYSLADRMGDHGVRVNAINPGWTETQMLAESPLNEGEEGKEYEAMLKQMIPAGRFGKPQEVANVALFLASDLSSYVNGERILVDGGYAHT